MKLRVRVVPSIVAYARRFCRAPASLAFGFACYLLFMRGEIQVERETSGLYVPQDGQGDRVREAWARAGDESDADIASLVAEVLADQDLWDHDLTALPGFTDAVTEHLTRAHRSGMAAALDAHLAAATPA
jgi:tagaturonate reductase